jgi:hypothetical protein
MKNVIASAAIRIQLYVIISLDPLNSNILHCSTEDYVLSIQNDIIYQRRNKTIAFRNVMTLIAMGNDPKARPMNAEVYVDIWPIYSYRIIPP